MPAEAARKILGKLTSREGTVGGRARLRVGESGGVTVVKFVDNALVQDTDIQEVEQELTDLIDSGTVPVARLTEVHRQAGGSWIVRAAHAVNRGEVPESAPPGGSGDFYFVEASDPDAVVGLVRQMVTERIPRKFGLDPFRDVQVLSPQVKTTLGVANLNRELQAALNAAGMLTRSEAAPYAALSEEDLADGQFHLDAVRPGGGPGGANISANAPTAGALYDYLIIARSKDLGVHNPTYAKQLLWDSIKQIKGTNPTSLPSRPN